MGLGLESVESAVRQILDYFDFEFVAVAGLLDGRCVHAQGFERGFVLPAGEHCFR